MANGSLSMSIGPPNGQPISFVYGKVKVHLALVETETLLVFHFWRTSKGPSQIPFFVNVVADLCPPVLFLILLLNLRLNFRLPRRLSWAVRRPATCWRT